VKTASKSIDFTRQFITAIIGQKCGKRAKKAYFCRLVKPQK